MCPRAGQACPSRDEDRDRAHLLLLLLLLLLLMPMLLMPITSTGGIVLGDFFFLVVGCDAKADT